MIKGGKDKMTDQVATILYLASGYAKIKFDNVVYQDKYIFRDLGGDMLEIDIDNFDILIATPPCNYYSKLNRNRDRSEYALKTRELLPRIIEKFSNQDKPYIIENVRSHIINDLIKKSNFNGFVIQHGRHTYWTNIWFNPVTIKQTYDFKATGRRGDGKIKRLKDNVQGGENVNQVIEYWVESLGLLS